MSFIQKLIVHSLDSSKSPSLYRDVSDVSFIQKLIVHSLESSKSPYSLESSKSPQHVLYSEVNSALFGKQQEPIYIGTCPLFRGKNSTPNCRQEQVPVSFKKVERQSLWGGQNSGWQSGLDVGMVYLKRCLTFGEGRLSVHSSSSPCSASSPTCTKCYT